MYKNKKAIIIGSFFVSIFNMVNITKGKDLLGGHDLELLRATYMRYIALSKMLFGQEESVYDINELKKDNEFYKDAVAIAKSLGIKWKTMTHDESNRVMLALLEDTYNAMAAVGDKKNLAIEVKLKVIKN